MPVQDASGRFIDVGSFVNIPGVVLSIGGTGPSPTVVVQTKYAGVDGDKDTMNAVDAKQVLEDI